MRRLLTPAIAFAWAACFTAQAAQWSGAMASDGAIQLFGVFMVWGSLAAAGLFLWVVATSIAPGLREGPPRQVVRTAFASAALLLAPGAVMAIATAEAELATLLFLQLCALGASHLVAERDGMRGGHPVPANDNRPLTARLMAARAARLAMLDEFSPRASRRPGAY